MTHSELLERLDDQIEKSKLIGCECAACDNALALRAVVKLHTPATKNSFTNNDCICMLPNRKCATIQAIEKELQ